VNIREQHQEQKEKIGGYSMRKHVGKIMLFACLCLIAAFGFSGKDLHAADVSGSVKKVAYIDTNDSLVLRFVPFSSAGYTWQLNGNGQTLNGSLAGNASSMSVNIKGFYANKQTYTLVLTATDNKNSIKVEYYTGAGIKGSKLSQKKTSINASWGLNESKVKNDYSGYKIDVANASGNLEMYIEKNINSAKTKKATFKGAGIPSGKQRAYVVGMKSGAFGYGEEKELSYAAKPSKVTGLTLKAGAEQITATWNAAKNATGYAVYMKKPGSSSYKLQKKVSGTSYTAKGLQKKKTYSFKVKAFAKAGKTTMEAGYSTAKSCKVLASPDAVTQFQFITDRAGVVLGLQWAAPKGAKSYVISLRESGKGAFVDQGETRQLYYSYRHLDATKTYDVKVYAKSGSRLSKASKTITVCPEKYLKEHRTELLAKKVRGIRYLKNGKCDYTKGNYSPETKVAYVNYKGLSSKTSYLIWVSLYTQQATIYQGSKGNWKMIRTFDIASGSWHDRTPRGTHKLFKHETKWQHKGWRTSCVTHFYKKASFHMRPKYNNGKLKDARIGQPISAACVRCKDEDAKFIYNLPLGTTVKIY
jgi:hypothetical protein